MSPKRSLFASAWVQFSAIWRRGTRAVGRKGALRPGLCARLAVEQLEDRLTPTEFLFRGVGFLANESANMRIPLPTQNGDVVVVKVRLDGDPSEATLERFQDGKTHPSQGSQPFGLLSFSPEIGPRIVDFENVRFGQPATTYIIPAGTGETLTLTGLWDGDETATVNVGIFHPQVQHDVSNLVVEAHRDQIFHVGFDNSSFERLRFRDVATAAASVPAGSPNPTSVGLEVGGPFMVVLEGLNRRIHLVGPHGRARDGSPFIMINTARTTQDGIPILDFGELTLPVRLRFDNPDHLALKFTPRVLAGPGVP
jgi:hypothetical protein